MDKKLAQGIAIGFMIMYFLLPVDIIPDIPIIGQLDEGIILMLLAWAGGFMDKEPTYKVIEENS